MPFPHDHMTLKCFTAIIFQSQFPLPLLLLSHLPHLTLIYSSDGLRPPLGSHQNQGYQVESGPKPSPLNQAGKGFPPYVTGFKKPVYVLRIGSALIASLSPQQIKQLLSSTFRLPTSVPCRIPSSQSIVYELLLALLSCLCSFLIMIFTLS